MADPTIINSILTNDILKKVFETVLENRSLFYKDIVGTVTDEAGVAHSPEVGTAVETLVKADLIKERTSSIKDFSTYSITSDGLTTGKRLNSAGF